MGTTLTGTTPQDTYDSLIKVTDNGPLSGTAKYLSDGLGNDSVLALSTARVGVGTTSPSVALHTNGVIRSANSGNTVFTEVQNDGVYATATDLYLLAPATKFVSLYAGGAESMRITSAGNVGIGTSAPNFILETAGTTGIGVRSTGVDGVYTDILSSIFSGNANEQNAIQASVSGNALESGFRFQVSDGSGLSTQTLGYQLNRDRHIFYTNGSERVRVTTNGLTFNGDTAAANALDDYEEGTWTPTINFSGASVGVTYNFNVGRYTKIGNKITANCFVSVSNKGTSTGNLAVGGLPFALATGTSNYIPVSIRPSQISFADQLIGYAEEQATQVLFQETTMGGAVTSITEADCATAFSAMLQITYFV